MATERKVREALINVFEILRQQESALRDLANEVAAIRESLIEIGPKYDQILSRHRARRAGEAKPFAAEDFRKFQAIIDELRKLP